MPETLTKKDLVECVRGFASLTADDATGLIEVLLIALSDAFVAGRRVELRGFGIFTVKEVAARMGRNPVTGAPVHIPACRRVHFKASKELKDALEKQQ